MDGLKKESQLEGGNGNEGKEVKKEGSVAAATLSASDRDKERLRFEMELEFLQCLANPLYLNSLAQQLYLEDESFIEYLKYLQYWKQPEYAKFIVYPHALYFLDLLQTEEFRKALKNTKFCEDIHLQQFYHWQYYYGKPQEAAPTKTPEETTSAS